MWTCARYVSALAATCSSSSGGRVAFRPLGSPMRPVKSPIRNVTSCPRSWNWRILLSSTVCPRCKSGAVGSNPALIRSGRPSPRRAASSSRRSSSSAPRSISASCSSTDGVFIGVRGSGNWTRAVARVDALQTIVHVLQSRQPCDARRDLSTLRLRRPPHHRTSPRVTTHSVRQRSRCIDFTPPARTGGDTPDRGTARRRRAPLRARRPPAARAPRPDGLGRPARARRRGRARGHRDERCAGPLAAAVGGRHDGHACRASPARPTRRTRRRAAPPPDVLLRRRRRRPLRTRGRSGDDPRRAGTGRRAGRRDASSRDGGPRRRPRRRRRGPRRTHPPSPRSPHPRPSLRRRSPHAANGTLRPRARPS